MHNYGCIITAAQFRLHTYGCTITAAQFGLHNYGCAIWAEQFGLPNYGCAIWVAQIGLHNYGCAIWAAQFGLHNLGCTISLLGESHLPLLSCLGHYSALPPGQVVDHSVPQSGSYTLYDLFFFCTHIYSLHLLSFTNIG